MTTRLLTPAEVAEQLQVSEKTVRRLARRGQLAVVRVGGQLRFRQVDVDAYVDASRSATETERRRASIRALPDRPATRRALRPGYWGD